MLLGIRWGNLRAKIIAWSFVPTAIILLVVALVAFYAYQQVSETLAIERDQALAYLSSDRLATDLKVYTDVLSALARTPDVYQNEPSAQADGLKRASNNLAGFDAGVLLLDTFGRVVAAEPERPEILGQDWSDRLYYRDIVRARTSGSPPQSITSDVVSDGPGDAAVVAAAMPVIGEQGEFRGALVGMLHLGTLAINPDYGVNLLRIGEGGSTYLVDSNGRVIYHPDPEHLGEDLAAQPVVQHVLSGNTGAMRTRDLGGQSIVAGYAPVPGTSWGLVTEERWAALTSDSQRYQPLLLFLLVLGVVVPAIVAYGGSTRLVRPIGDLIDAAQEVAQGSFGRTISADTGDEIEELAGQFNLMSQQLQESYANLEQKVADRTRELATLNAVTTAVSRSLNLDETLSDALDKTMAMLEADLGGILLMEPEGATMTLRASRGFTEELRQAVRHLRGGRGISGQAVAQSKPVVVNLPDYPDEQLTPLLVKEGVQTLASTPITHKERILGAMTLATRRPRAFPPEEQELLAAIGRQVGVAVENSRLYAQAQQELIERKRAEAELRQVNEEHARRVRELALLNRVIIATTSKLDTKSVLEAVCRELAEAFDLPQAATALFPRDGPPTALTVVAEYTPEDGVSALGHVIPVEGNPATQFVLEHKSPLAVTDAQRDPRMAPVHHLMRERGVASLLILPLLVGDQVVGTIGLDAFTPREFTDAEITLAGSAAAAAAQALENAWADEALRQAKEAAETANRAKSAFLANMSHELRTPLNAILGFTQLMTRDGSLTTDQRENLDTIARSGEHLLDLINDVLEMSKIEAGRTTLVETNFDVHRLLDDLEDMFSLRAKNKGLQLIFDRAPDVPEYVRTDEGKLRQVLINLLSNAIKFTTDGGVTLRVATKDEGLRLRAVHVRQRTDEQLSSTVRRPPGALVFEVEDTGPGISPDDLRKVFDPFVQTESGQASQEGTGLGLPISREFVHLMGGELTAKSESGRGSLFRFDVRIEPTEASEVHPKQRARRVVGLEPGQPVYRLLVVEDRETNRKLLVKLLAPLGFDIQTAVNGQEAVELWQRWEPHLIWMDMRMPVMDGYEAAQRIKSTTGGQATVIIALTASAFEEDRALILSAGCDDFVRKPFREHEIFDALAKHLGVRFIYDEAGDHLTLDQPADAEDVLNPAVLAALPPEWIAEFHQAATQADADHALELIDQIRAQHKPLADALAGLVNNFRFDTVMDLTQP